MGDGQGEKKRERQDLEDLGQTCPTHLGLMSCRCPRGGKAPGPADGDKAAVSARMSVPVSHSGPSGWEQVGARSPRGGSDNRCTDGAGEGMMAFSEHSLCFWHGTEHFYTQSHFLPTVTLSTEAVITLPR